MSKCSECGGSVATVQNAVYRVDGATSGIHFCEDCGRSKRWYLAGNLVEETIDMSVGDAKEKKEFVVPPESRPEPGGV